MKLHKEFPDSHIYQYDLAEIQHALKRYKDESAMWELFMQHSPIPGDGCPQIGESYRAQGMEAETLKAFHLC